MPNNKHKSTYVQPRPRSLANMAGAKIEASAYLHSGPLPDPQHLEKYEFIVPGAAERIIKMAENQANHRQQLEKSVIKSNIRDSLLGVIFAFILGAMTIVCGTILIIYGHDISGTLLCGTGLTGLVGTFIYGTRSSKKEREEKSKEIE